MAGTGLGGESNPWKKRVALHRATDGVTDGLVDGVRPRGGLWPLPCRAREQGSRNTGARRDGNVHPPSSEAGSDVGRSTIARGAEQLSRTRCGPAMLLGMHQPPRWDVCHGLGTSVPTPERVTSIAAVSDQPSGRFLQEQASLATVRWELSGSGWRGSERQAAGPERGQAGMSVAAEGRAGRSREPATGSPRSQTLQCTSVRDARVPSQALPGRGRLYRFSLR